MPKVSPQSYFKRAGYQTKSNSKEPETEKQPFASEDSHKQDDPKLEEAKKAVEGFAAQDTRGKSAEEAINIIREDKDAFMRKLQGEGGGDEVVEYLAEIEYVKREIREVHSNRDLLRKAEVLISQDWLGHITAMKGNIYAIAAFGSIWPDHKWDNTYETLQLNATAYTKFFGCFVIVLIQFIGPPLVVISKLPGNMGALDEKAYAWRCWPSPLNPFYKGEADADICGSGVVPDEEAKPPYEISMFVDWGHIATTKILGILFMILFMLNGLFVVLQEKNTFRNVYNTFRFLREAKKKTNQTFQSHGRFYLLLGSILNNWVVMWSCVGVFLIVGASKNPSDLLLDALGLLFLYNIDDIDGDLGFLGGDDWPAQRLGWIYEEIVKQDEDFDEKKLDWNGYIGTHLYTGVSVIVGLSAVVLPAFAGFVPFLMIVPNDD